MVSDVTSAAPISTSTHTKKRMLTSKSSVKR